jgi:hypothetical protein
MAEALALPAVVPVFKWLFGRSNPDGSAPNGGGVEMNANAAFVNNNREVRNDADFAGGNVGGGIGNVVNNNQVNNVINVNNRVQIKLFPNFGKKMMKAAQYFGNFLRRNREPLNRPEDGFQDVDNTTSSTAQPDTSSSSNTYCGRIIR